MAKIKIIMLLSMHVIIAYLCSCVDIPLEFVLTNAIELSEDEVRDIADSIYDTLTKIDFTHKEDSDAQINPEKCRKAWKIWLRAQFDKGLVPKKTVSPSEYGNNSDPLILECRSINLEEEYKEAIKKNNVEDLEVHGAFILSFADFRARLNQNRCTGNFIDLDKEKIAVSKISLNVLENTLSVDAPTFKLYTTFEDDINEKSFTKDTEKNMLEDGTIMLLATSRPVPVGFLGKLPLNLNPNEEEFRDAEGPYASLDGNMIVFPSAAGAAPNSTMRGKEAFYVVPSGAYKANLSTYLNIRFSSKDLQCALDRYKEEVRKKQQDSKPQS